MAPRTLAAGLANGDDDGLQSLIQSSSQLAGPAGVCEINIRRAVHSSWQLPVPQQVQQEELLLLQGCTAVWPACSEQL